MSLVKKIWNRESIEPNADTKHTMTTSAPSKNYADDVSLLVVTLDTNPFFWSSFPFHFSEFLSQVLAFLNSILLLGQLNQVVVIATGCNSCSYVYDSASDKNHASTNGTMPAIYSNLLHNLDEFVAKDQQLTTPHHKPGTIPSSLLSGALSMALCCILFSFSLCLFTLVTDFSWNYTLFLIVRVFNLFYYCFCWKLKLNYKLCWIWICNASMKFLFDLISLLDIQRAFRSGPMHPQPRVCMSLPNHQFVFVWNFIVHLNVITVVGYVCQIWLT